MLPKELHAVSAWTISAVSTLGHRAVLVACLPPMAFERVWLGCGLNAALAGLQVVFSCAVADMDVLSRSCTWRMAKQHGPKCLILRLSPRLRCRRWLRSATGLRSWMPCPAPLMRWPRSTAWRWLCSNVLNRCLTSTPLQSAIGAELGLKHRAATSCRWSANLRALRMLRRSHPSLWVPTWREVLRHQPCPQQILSLVLSKSTYRSQSGKVSCRQLLETEWSALSILARRGHIGQPKRHGHQRLRRFWLQAQSSKVPGSWPAMTFWSSWATRTASTSPFWPIPSSRRC